MKRASLKGPVAMSMTPATGNAKHQYLQALIVLLGCPRVEHGDTVEIRMSRTQVEAINALVETALMLRPCCDPACCRDSDNPFRRDVSACALERPMTSDGKPKERMRRSK
jgi:hypothetical protein